MSPAGSEQKNRGGRARGGAGAGEEHILLRPLKPACSRMEVCVEAPP